MSKKRKYTLLELAEGQYLAYDSVIEKLQEKISIFAGKKLQVRKKMLELGAIHLSVNINSGTSHANRKHESWMTECGLNIFQFNPIWLRVGSKPSCKKCLRILKSR